MYNTIGLSPETKKARKNKWSAYLMYHFRHFELLWGGYYSNVTTDLSVFIIAVVTVVVSVVAVVIVIVDKRHTPKYRGETNLFWISLFVYQEGSVWVVVGGEAALHLHRWRRRPAVARATGLPQLSFSSNRPSNHSKVKTGKIFIFQYEDEKT